MEAKVSRSSNLELLRIIAMLVIVAHHYVVNSGLMTLIKANPENMNSIMLLIFGWGGKTAINCFVLITGYFMCKKQITVEKYMKLFTQVLFYNIVIGAVFVIAGYQQLNVKFLITALFPFNNVGNSGSFTTSYLFFFLLIPYINILIKNMSIKEYKVLLCLSLFMYCLLPSIGFKTAFSSVIWFSVIYLIGAYIRLFIDAKTVNYKVMGKLALVFLLISWVSIILMIKVGAYLGKFAPYWLVADENKILALLLAISTFLFFLKLPLPNSSFINTISAAAFGVLLIHANSAAMRTWLWKDLLNNVGQYGSQWMMIHAILSVVGIYTVCSIIEICRIKYLENIIVDFSTKYIKKITDKLAVCF